MGITKYDAKQDPVQWLRFYAISIKNAGGNKVPLLSLLSGPISTYMARVT
jgi:hypothetical protein